MYAQSNHESHAVQTEDPSLISSSHFYIFIQEGNQRKYSRHHPKDDQYENFREIQENSNNQSQQNSFRQSILGNAENNSFNRSNHSQGLIHYSRTRVNGCTQIEQMIDYQNTG